MKIILKIRGRGEIPACGRKKVEVGEKKNGRRSKGACGPANL
jgi:hypothetical protein